MTCNFWCNCCLPKCSHRFWDVEGQQNSLSFGHVTCCRLYRGIISHESRNSVWLGDPALGSSHFIHKINADSVKASMCSHEIMATNLYGVTVSHESPVWSAMASRESQILKRHCSCIHCMTATIFFIFLGSNLSLCVGVCSGCVDMFTAKYPLKWMHIVHFKVIWGAHTLRSYQ